MGFRTQAQVDRLRLPAGKADAYVWDDEQAGLSIRLKGAARRSKPEKQPSSHRAAPD